MNPLMYGLGLVIILTACYFSFSYLRRFRAYIETKVGVKKDKDKNLHKTYPCPVAAKTPRYVQNFPLAKKGTHQVSVQQYGQLSKKAADGEGSSYIL